MTDTVLYTQEDHVAFLTFNRPENMNTLNREMTNQLEELTGKIKRDPHIRAVVLRGAGEAFMAGSDLYEVYKELDTPAGDTINLVRQFNATTLALREMDKPVLAVVHGLVGGAGISLMLATDLVIASQKTQFSLGYCKVATSPVGGVTYSLPRLVGHKKAMELLLMSEMFDAEKAAELGLVNWVIPQDELDVYVKKIVETLVNGPTLAYAQTKQLLNSSWQNKLTTQLELEAESFVKTFNSRDFKAAVRAFVNKRQPEFEGR